MTSPYVIQNDHSARCKHCGEPVDLLCDREGNTRKPWFYICWGCKVVAHLAVGEVQRVVDSN